MPMIEVWGGRNLVHSNPFITSQWGNDDCVRHTFVSSKDRENRNSLWHRDIFDWQKTVLIITQIIVHRWQMIIRSQLTVDRWLFDCLARSIVASLLIWSRLLFMLETHFGLWSVIEEDYSWKRLWRLKVDWLSTIRYFSLFYFSLCYFTHQLPCPNAKSFLQVGS